MATASPVFNPPVSGGQTVISTPYVASFTPDLSLGDNLMFVMELTGNVTVANPINTVEGREFTFRFLQGGGGGFTISFGSAYRGSNDTALPSTTSTAGATDYFAFKHNSVSGKEDFVAPNKGFL